MYRINMETNWFFEEREDIKSIKDAFDIISCVKHNDEVSIANKIIQKEYYAKCDLIAELLQHNSYIKILEKREKIYSLKNDVRNYFDLIEELFKDNIKILEKREKIYSLKNDVRNYCKNNERDFCVIKIDKEMNYSIVEIDDEEYQEINNSTDSYKEDDVTKEVYKYSQSSIDIDFFEHYDNDNLYIVKVKNEI